MARSRSFQQVDVFSAKPYRGNPLAVILDGEGMSSEEMSRIAVWTNLSETTFLVPPSAPEADYRVRIFTPKGELGFAGHPTLGSAHAWLNAGGVPHRDGIVVQECGAGLIQIRRDGDLLAFAAPPTLRSGDLEDELLADVVDALGLSREQVLAHQWVDNGPGWGVLRLDSADDVLALEPDLSRIPTAMIGVIGAYPEGSEFAYEMRTFAPAVGVPEDPVCGSMNASVAQWVTGFGASAVDYRVSQGARVGRAGEISINSDGEGTVWVGGATVTLFSGVAVA